MNKQLKKDLTQQRHDIVDAEVREIEKRVAARKRKIGSGSFTSGGLLLFPECAHVFQAQTPAPR